MGTYLDVNIFSRESSWELGPHQEQASTRKPRVRARWVPPKLHHHPREAVMQGGEARLCTGCWKPGEQVWLPACLWLDTLPSLTYLQVTHANLAVRTKWVHMQEGPRHPS